jgi:hypothetical protein
MATASIKKTDFVDNVRVETLERMRHLFVVELLATQLISRIGRTWSRAGDRSLVAPAG